ncbi:hypothetical protein [Paraburkholderia aspalathi]|uniref:hypothetical protein n=1 Tax=Paraburkholderia aspalathi TaxID=1324617 RepID=UPI00190B9AEA|nr:hypothetical protein [Paraburkholderia aspalathi]MBK3844748.1 hypothetical protein [Paraburkholderia aspalathi]
MNPNFLAIQDAFVKNATYNVPFAPIPANIPRIADGEIAQISGSQLTFSDFLSHNATPIIKNALPQTIEWIAFTLNPSQPAGTVSDPTSTPLARSVESRSM